MTILVGKVCMLTALVPEVVDLIGSELQPKPGKFCIAQASESVASLSSLMICSERRGFS